jgi:hypothetical protein
MHLNTRKLFTLLILVVLLAGMLPMVGAQDGPTEEEQALLDRLFAGIEQVNAYESFVTTIESVESQQQSITQDGTEVQNTTETQEKSLEATVIRGDAPNGSYTATISYSATNAGAPVVEYSADGEFIYADGVLYGRATVTEGEPEEPLPAEFVELADPSANEFSERFDTNQFVESVLGEEDPEELFSNTDLMTEYFTSITSSEEEIDGETFEVITLRFEGEDLTGMLSVAPGMESSAPLFASLDEGGFAEIAMLFDEAGMPVGVHTSLLFGVTDLSISELDPTQPEGINFTLSADNQQLQLFSQINEELEPAVAPE